MGISTRSTTRRRWYGNRTTLSSANGALNPSVHLGVRLGKLQTLDSMPVAIRGCGEGDLQPGLAARAVDQRRSKTDQATVTLPPNARIDDPVRSLFREQFSRKLLGLGIAGGDRFGLQAWRKGFRRLQNVKFP